MVKNFWFLKVTEVIDVKSRLGSGMVQKISNLLRFENGFEIRNLHHFVSKKVPHIVSRILKVTEIQRIRSTQLMLKNR